MWLPGLTLCLRNVSILLRIGITDLFSLFYSISLHECIWMFIHSTNGRVSWIWGLFWIILQEHSCAFGTQYCFPVGYTLERGIAGSQNKCMFNFTAIRERFFIEIVFIYTLNRSVWKSISSTFLTTLGIVSILLILAFYCFPQI